ncbi:hypothetical protein [Roseovarius autotrophicus]|uniref:hypothetical protein n=1 Tax=Roseovarius autotrophicus TaxID=2824121 RepID=UPI001FFDBB6B|nr:hypothetical protein [Roseovarius autotrophicus]
MKRRVFLGLVAAGALAGCGAGRDRTRRESGGLFGRRRARRAAATSPENTNPLIPQGADSEESLFSSIQRRRREQPYEGTPVAVVTALEAKQASGGVIVRVEGLSLRQGAFDVRLVPDNPEASPVNGVLGYELRAVQPADTPQGPESARMLLAGVFVSRKTLDEVREIRVRAAQNERIIRL